MNLPRLQLYLSTLLIVTLLAAGLVWLNVRDRPLLEYDKGHGAWQILPGILEHSHETFIPFPTRSRFDSFRGRGWPWTVAAWSDNSSALDAVALGYDIAVGVTLLALAAVAIEWLTRRMKRRITGEVVDQSSQRCQGAFRRNDINVPTSGKMHNGSRGKSSARTVLFNLL